MVGGDWWWWEVTGGRGVIVNYTKKKTSLMSGME